jgi:hypothetical protein
LRTDRYSGQAKNKKKAVFHPANLFQNTNRFEFCMFF